MAKIDYTLNKDGKYTAVQLVQKFFGANLQEMKGLSIGDREQLASGIARFEGISESECSFVHVPY